MNSITATAGIWVLSAIAAACGSTGPSHAARRGGTAFLREDFVGLASWSVISGTPVLDAGVGTPPPAVRLTNAEIKSIASFASDSGLDLAVEIRLVSGVAVLKLATQAIGPLLILKIFDDGSVVYVTCRGVTCAPLTHSYPIDGGWHRYRLVYDWRNQGFNRFRDDILQFGESNLGTQQGLQVHLAGFPIQGTGPTEAFFDSLRVTNY